MSAVTISDGQTPDIADIAALAAELDDERLELLVAYAQDLREEMTS